ncbi:hypothetical protein A8C32_18000 [Flavivirga aquatica]|uniref:HTH araC/xylS-type domain-containing protein n=1 Tax=Flavivirga aquatica TaxID=1849968 RepID=A0A1E5T7J3_9FLAO|nr:AraC family transcriptional regulator [Flavivirga aquatica]OEK07330.1 hypothetical protein A8C32_18000 [Flavivirga aquatica]
MSYINKYNCPIFNLKELQFNLGGNIKVINGINTLSVNNSNGKGRIRYLNFDKGLASINIDLLLHKNFSFSLNNSNNDMLQFIYCLEGISLHSFENSIAIRKLDELQTAFLKSDANTKNIIHIKPNKRAVINIISIDKKVYFKNETNTSYLPKSKLLELLNILNSNEPIYFGSYNLKIGEYVKALLKTNTEDEITESMNFRAISYFILANHIEQLFDESIQSINHYTLTATELKRISSTIEDIKTNPQEQYSIEMLCHKTRLSPAKLQEGFKALSNRTVSDFIRHIRLKKALHLLKTTDLNISEIVYSIGFTSRSYFCKIFKAKYGCSPKHYKKNKKLTATISTLKLL